MTAPIALTPHQEAVEILVSDGAVAFMHITINAPARPILPDEAREIEARGKVRGEFLLPLVVDFHYKRRMAQASKAAGKPGA